MESNPKSIKYLFRYKRFIERVPAYRKDLHRILIEKSIGWMIKNIRKKRRRIEIDGSYVTLRGGTVQISPPAEDLRTVFLSTLSPIGIQAEREIIARRFYPVGGGQVEVLVHPAALPLRPLTIEGRVQSGPGLQIAY